MAHRVAQITSARHPRSADRAPRQLPAAASGDQPVVAAARKAITSRHPAAAGLLPLARLVGTSPYRLSRAFQLVMGVSVTRYRNRIRVGAALSRLEQVEPSLAWLATDLGFADQAHLTRTVRAHLGDTPARLRRRLAADRAGRARRTAPGGARNANYPRAD